MAKSSNQDVKAFETRTAEDVELHDVDTSHIAPKYQGTDEDKVHMRTLGRRQETRRMFTFISMLGFGSTLIVTWETLLTNSSAIITNGGTAGLFWGFLIVFGGFLFVYASLITLNNANYVAQGWHGTLITIGVVLFCVLFNTYGARQLPLVEGSLAILHFGGLFVIIIILCQVHMSEETENATRAMPRSIMWSTYVNGFLGFIMAITMMFTMGDLDKIVKTPTGYPFIQIFYNVTNSYVGTTLMTQVVRSGRSLETKACHSPALFDM
ncbi:hypothetical protein LTR08_004606 [Meristemomyces frigidus]|nr:hypothetical protein LTR08_004606 [Meristemomyces frigidus]